MTLRTTCVVVEECQRDTRSGLFPTTLVRPDQGTMVAGQRQHHHHWQQSGPRVNVALGSHGQQPRIPGMWAKIGGVWAKNEGIVVWANSIVSCV